VVALRAERLGRRPRDLVLTVFGPSAYDRGALGSRCRHRITLAVRRLAKNLPQSQNRH
jgi:hypothetical protein